MDSCLLCSQDTRTKSVVSTFKGSDCVRDVKVGQISIDFNFVKNQNLILYIYNT